MAFGLILLTIRYGEPMRKFGKRWEGGSDSESHGGTEDVEKAAAEKHEKGGAGSRGTDETMVVDERTEPSNPRGNVS